MTPSSHRRAQNVANAQKMRLLFITQDENIPEYLLSDSQAAHIIHDNYNVVKKMRDSPEYYSLQRVWPGISGCTFAVVNPEGIYWHSEFSDEKACLEFLLSPKEFGIWHASADVYQHIISQSSEGTALSEVCDFLPGIQSETSGTRDDSTRGSRSDHKEKCVLSVRLMEGGSAKAQFNATDCLKDVKRWLQQELNLLLIPEEDITVSRYTNIGHFEPSRYAFFYPATRKTFSEAQEFVKLEDLGLCPRLALILRPDYDENAMKAAREAENNTFKNLISNTSHILQALYSFFEYKVDDATNFSQEEVELPADENLKPPHFLAATGPTPSASPINVYGSKNEVTNGSDDFLGHAASSQANGENIMNVAREEY
ncbi:hypothetical protein METBIDRAFT_9217 [Metschnikowia bicuspidata var. bicuspidata NRRL YB-4993]|uniref:UBX domain-containing protein n=1 Tax=Metschnikowia bicuspidata var. bicuspidata NRRL YB-4993 TaxID=869754 RepID=A0A1A0HFT7_9ASCO|nr:hypothetical protein METBIDRAFT_9217 [Metschnikowia bicuspidata var. bicuspidata NRRL YB-4993]OBA22866.1 hypothetical protein METBIDRAFT_9217 [Metschnikowia bicuspidata var. bicuspidata NRRL YB-4993]